MKGIILEGIPAGGKTRLIDALRRRPELLARPSTLVLGEHYTERAVEGLPHPGPHRYEQLAYRVLGMLEPLRVMTIEGRVFGGSGVDLRLRYILERFHLTAAACHAAGDLGMFRRIENALLPYHPLLVLVTLPPERIEERLRDTLPRRPECWRQFLFRQGATWEAIASFYTAQQTLYRELLAHSRLPTLEIDGTREPEEAAAELAAPLADS
ncbi:MAG: hypothetical protein HYU66_25055 [Armatimonadetes bacterium]|nr:hypothetical protein [Armatimonadota bacterium]